MEILALDNPELNLLADEFVFENQHGSLWQSSKWMDFQENLGKKTFALGVFDTARRTDPSLPGTLVAVARVVETPLPLGKKYWYIPRGPVWSDDLAAKELLLELTNYAKKSKVIFISYDPEIDSPEDLPTFPTHTNQPQDTLLVDLTPSEEEILAQMKQKGRYNIRLAQKKGVTVRKHLDVKNFYKLLQKTTERDGFSGWGKEYYEKMLKNLGDDAVLFEGVYEGKVICAGIFTYSAGKAVYYYGASSNQHRNVMAPYLLQWEAMLEGKSRGCCTYDFLGIAPADAPASHPWAGVTSFKTKFGGKHTTYPKAKRLVISSFWTLLYKLKTGK